MNKLTITILLITILSSCNNNTRQQKNSTELAESFSNRMDCYSFNNGKDSINMSIEKKNNKAYGNLAFNYYEKDSNKGTFRGNISGDTLWVDYTFMSEGVVSKREVVFLKVGNDWIQGYGEVLEKEGNFIFTNHNDIRFDNNFA